MTTLFRLTVLAFLLLGISGAFAVPRYELRAGESLIVRPQIKREISTTAQSRLRLLVERLPESPFVPLSLEVRLLKGTGESVHLRTFSFYGVRAGEAVTFLEPLPKRALVEGKDTDLAFELILQARSTSESAPKAGIRINDAVVEPMEGPVKDVDE